MDSPSSDRLVADVLKRCLATLESEGLELCILHGYTHFPEHVPSDVDAVCREPAGVPRVLAQSEAARVVQVLRHEHSAYYCVLQLTDSERPRFLAIDVSRDYRRNGRIFLSGAQLMANRRREDGFCVPSVDAEFICYLIKKLAKAELAEDHWSRLCDLYQGDPSACRAQLRRFFSSACTARLEGALTSRAFSEVAGDRDRLRRSLLRRSAWRAPASVAAYYADEVRRVLERMRHPTGLLVALIGPDGSGKSSLRETICADLAPAFRRTFHVHVRPGAIGRPRHRGPSTEPHARPARGRLASAAKVAHLLVDYWVGYWTRIYPRLCRSTLIVFERYYHDLLADPLRYRYGGSLRLAELVGRCMPRPDLWIILDAPAEVIRRRKREVAHAECERQREAYRSLLADLPNAVILDASKPAAEVAAAVERVLLDHMANRTARRLGFSHT